MDPGRDPLTNEEWQDAADWAELLLLIDSAQKYGLITGGPKANVDRCVEILGQAKRRGITPTTHTDEHWEKLIKGE